MSTSHTHDVIVVGARCAGAPLAMLLARQGHDVMLIDRMHFPSDTVSTHLVHPPGVDALARWGLLEQLRATGCPPIATYSFDFGPFTIAGQPHSADGASVAYCPRRFVLDALLVDAAVAAGATLRDGVTFDDVIVEDGRVVGIRAHSTAGPGFTERARVVVGADGAHSRVAAAVSAQSYREQPPQAVAYYSYWSGIPVSAASWALRPGHGYGALPTNDGLTLLLAAWPHAALGAVKQDIEGHYMHAIQDMYGERLDRATRHERIVGGAVANHFRHPFGPGWALVGDAGYLKDPVTAQGITDAFHDAERCATAIHEALSEQRTFDEAMSAYREDRDERALPMYEFTMQLATLEPPPPPLAQLLTTVASDQAAMNDFVSVFAGTTSPSAFFEAHDAPPAPATSV